MTVPSLIRIVAMVEASSVSGSAKAVLEFGREALKPIHASPRIDLSILLFHRGHSEPDNPLTQAIHAAGLPLDVVYEDKAFDFRVAPQLRHVIGVRRADVVWSNSIKSHFLVRYSNVRQDRRWVAFHHGYTTTDIKMRLYNQLDYWSLRAADAVITVCNPFALQVRNRGVSSSRIHVQHMPVRPFVRPDADTIRTVRENHGLPSGTPVLLSVGRLSDEKGHADIIRAAADLRSRNPKQDFRLVIVGEGPERTHLERLTAELSLVRQVIFTGQQRDVSPYYAMADVFVLPSHSEGSPNVLLEALAAGLPVVATTAGGIPEMVQNGHDALLVPVRDVTALASAVGRLLQDDTLRSRLSEASAAILSRNSPETYYRGLRSVFERALVS